MTAALVPMGRVTQCCAMHQPHIPSLPGFEMCVSWMPCCDACPDRSEFSLPTIASAMNALRPGWAAEDIGRALWFFDRVAWDVTVVHPNVATVVAVWRRTVNALAKEPF